MLPFIARNVTASVSLLMAHVFTRSGSAGSGPTSGQPDPLERRGSERYVVWAVAVVAAVVAALSSAAPTGLRVADALWCAALAGLVTVAASRARRWPTIWFAGVVSAGSLGSWWVVA